jgi:thioredoxin reductase
VLADDHVCPIRLHGNFVQDLNTELTPYVGDYKVADFFNETSTKGVYAAGDTMTMFTVLPNAVASGAQAAADIAVALQEEKYDLPSVWA